MSMSTSTSVQFTVGKLDAGMAILLTEDHHLIEFPSLLLPPGVTSGSIVNIGVNRNYDQEESKKKEFWELQEAILEEFGQNEPEPPVLNIKHVTQTSVLLEWEPLVLHQAKLKEIDVYRNYDHEGNQVQHIKIKTHTLENLTGINVCFGLLSIDDEQDGENPSYTKQELIEILERIGASYSEHVGPNTTHLLCNIQGGSEYQKALDGSIPIVKPDWLIACEKAGKMQPALPFYLVPQTPVSEENNK
ncbi:6038_t:CDS:2 [Funneliformis geosporum]|uniref:16786_t:CDS:1 n=1 Tax=Funneliformis geosporum TaxID=1117311 RepID=A0A9W4SAD0_9GLOM|nr:16786_t:CDS:2 [Funneliformis geosporum]CAI2178649.1 6038_t:CDS:2 [Funneliformis geosporum]